MIQHWTFGKKIGAGFAVIVLLALAIGVVSVYALRNVVENKDRVITGNAQLLVDAESLSASSEEKASHARGFLLTREEQDLGQMRETRRKLLQILDKLGKNVATDEERQLVGAIARAEAEHQQAFDRVIDLRRTAAPSEAVVRAFSEQVLPPRKRLDTAIDSFVSREGRLLEEAKQAATNTASSAITLMVAMIMAVVLIAGLVAFVLARTLSRQIGAAVGDIQSSSAELQAAANEQATGAKESSTSMNEITTTMSELLATSRQIAESARRVANVADNTAESARYGEGTVQKANDSIAGIRRQVDLVVDHMLDLGKKSQQIGAVLDIVSELAEQTNILSINATIEAAGAGEAGKRFAVVADEIRKLSDRVAGSTKEIRTLIEEVRGAVNTTVMATETGSKTVDTGSRQFDEVASAFRQIAALVTTTTEAAREIELSTKQQSTAVEQVNVAIANTAQATKETEASSGQTLQTASQLAILSRSLLRLVQPQAAA
jgi:methyl-accepting chemotaxis protein